MGMDICFSISFHQKAKQWILKSKQFIFVFYGCRVIEVFLSHSNSPF